MAFANRLSAIRKQRGFTQQALAEKADLHIVQICRYETGKAEPTLEALRKITRALNVPADHLVFEADEREPTDDLKLQFEAIAQFPEDERAVARALIESLIIRHDAHRWNRHGKKTG